MQVDKVVPVLNKKKSSTLLIIISTNETKIVATHIFYTLN